MVRLRALLLLLSVCVVPPAWPGGARAVVPEEPVPAPAHQLTLRIRDARSGVRLPARVSVVGPERESLYPLPRASHFYHEAYFGQKYFYVDDDVTLPVPEGRVVVRVSHGFEYASIQDTLEVDRDLDRTILLARIVNMGTLGWHGGDTHIHMNHGGSGAVYRLTADDLFAMQRAEDLHVANVLDNAPDFTGSLDPRSTGDYRLFFGIEYRSAFWGHLGVLGSSAATAFGCCSAGQPAFPMNLDLVQRAHELGGTVVFAHPVTVPREEMARLDGGWPWTGHGRELPIDVALGDVDAMDVMSYSNAQRVEYSTWYDLLNHGFHLPATAGTDASMNRWYDPPLGGFRVYARTEPGDWSYDGWLAAVRRGDSFITNGPLFRYFFVGNARPGGTVTLNATGESQTLYGSVDALCDFPLSELRILVNGQLAAILRPDPLNSRAIRGNFELNVHGRSAWVAAHVVGLKRNPFTIGGQLEAHTNPVYVQVPGHPLRFGGVDPAYYVNWIDEAWSLAQGKGFEKSEDRTLASARVALARRTLFARTTLAPPREGGEEPPDVEGPPGADEAATGRPRLTATPNPSSGPIRFHLAGLPERPERFALYDVQGRLIDVRRLPIRGLDEAGWTWTPDAGNAPAPGIYFAVFEGAGWSRRVRVIRGN